MNESLIRIRMSTRDAYYGGDLVNGSRMLDLFGDVGTDLMIKHDGDEGLLKLYKEVEFFKPVFAGDFIEACGKIMKVGNTSRVVNFEAWKVAESLKDKNNPSHAQTLEPPVLVCKATAIVVVPLENQRNKLEK